MDNKKKCFVIMPISETNSCSESEWKAVFEHMIKPAVTGSKLGFACERAKPRSGAFIKDILEQLNRSDVVIADLTDRNPNVCYELGIRHTLRNRTILIAQDMNHVPSDLQSYWVITYRKDLSGAAEFRKRVREILREMQENPDKSDSPVADFLANRNIDLLSIEKKTNLKKLSALMSETSYNLESVDAITQAIENNVKARTEGKEAEVSYLNRRLDNTCLELLIATQYISLSPTFVKLLRGHNMFIEMVNCNLENWKDDRFTQWVEKKLGETLPESKTIFENLLGVINQVKQDYAKDNYQEPKEPIIIFAKPEHEEYLKLT